MEMWENGGPQNVGAGSLYKNTLISTRSLGGKEQGAGKRSHRGKKKTISGTTQWRRNLRSGCITSPGENIESNRKKNRQRCSVGERKNVGEATGNRA